MGGFRLLQIVILALILRCASSEGRSEGAGHLRPKPLWGSSGVGADDSAHADHVLRHLRVTVKDSGLREAPSATQSYGTVELVNTHPNHTLTIYNMEVRPIGDEPVQITISAFAARVLRIGPGKTAVLPVSFYPAISSDDVSFAEYYFSNTDSDSDDAQMSDTAAADLASLVGDQSYLDYARHSAGGGADQREAFMSRRQENGSRHNGRRAAAEELKRLVGSDPTLEKALRSNPSLHAAVASLHMTSEPGGSEVFVAPILATAHPHNSYGLPSVAAGEVELTIQNPYNEDMHIVEVFSSNPAAVKVDQVWLNDELLDRRISDGPIVLRPGEECYIGTVRLVKAAGEDCYIHIRTSRGENLAVAVVTDARESSLVTGAGGRLHVLPEEKRPSADKLWNEEFDSDVSGVPDVAVSLGTAEKTRRKVADLLGEGSLGGEDVTLLSAAPPYVNMAMATSHSSQVSLNITNHGTRSLRLMRVSIGVDVQRDGRGQNTPQPSDENDLGLSIEVHIEGNPNDGGGTYVGANTPDGDGDVVVNPGETVVGAVVITCRPSPERARTNPRLGWSGDKSKSRLQPREFFGSVIIRAGDASLLHYDDWKEAIVRDPLGEFSSHISLEVPFKLDVVYGFLKYDVQKTYFRTGLAAHTRTKRGMIASEIDQTIDFSNGFPFSVILSSLRIVGIPSTTVGGHIHKDQSRGDSCRQYQLVGIEHSRKMDENGSLHEPWILLPEEKAFGRGTHIAKVRIRRNETVQFESQKCGLSVELLIGSYPPLQYVIPLHQYDGRLSARLDHRYMEAQARFLSCRRKRNLDIGLVDRSDTGCLSQWYDDALLGSRLKANLNAGVPADVASYQMHQTLTNNADHDELDPIVLNLGTLPPATLLSLSLFVTNPNPVSIDITPENGGDAIAGVSVGIGQLGSGNPMDLLGIQTEPSKMLDAAGDERLRRFLSSFTPFQDFSGRLSQSSAVWPATSKDSDRITAELSDLYYQRGAPTLHYVPSSAFEASASPLGHLLDCSCFANETFPADATNSRERSSWFGRHRKNGSYSGQYGNRSFSGLLLGSDGIRCYSTLPSSASSGNQSWSLPPASTGRFDLRIRSPPLSALLNQSCVRGTDVMSFLSTGLVLRTSLGQALPIILSYNIPNGEVIATTRVGPDSEDRSVDVDEGEGRLERIDVPARILPPRGYPEPLYSGLFNGRSVQFSIRSSFGASLECPRLWTSSPWFEVFLLPNQTRVASSPSNNTTHDLDIAAGVSRSSIRCKGSNFYSCALAVAESTSAILPGGCGLTEDEIDDAMRAHSWLHANDTETEESYDRRVGSASIAPASDVNKHETNSAKSVESRSALRIRTVAALRAASAELEGKYATSSTAIDHRQPRFNFLGPSDIRPFGDARMAWHQASAVGLHLMKGGLRISAEHGKMNTTLNTLLPRSILWSALDIPTLFNAEKFPPKRRPAGSTSPTLSYELDSQGTGVVEFGPTLLSEVAVAFIPVRNPSGVPVKLRLVTLSPSFIRDSLHTRKTADGASLQWLEDHWKDETVSACSNMNSLHVFKSTSSDTISSASSSHAAQSNGAPSDVWWTGGAYFQETGDGAVITSQHNITIKSTGGAHIALVNPSLHAVSALVAGCGGRRCGLRDGQQSEPQAGQQLSQQQQAHNDAQFALHNSPERLFSSIGASAARSESLRGHSYDSQGSQESSQYMDDVKNCLHLPSWKLSDGAAVPAFAVAADSMKEVILSPGEDAVLGPIFFRPPARARFGSTLLIENSLTGIEAVKVRGAGAVRKAIFSEVDAENLAETVSNGVMKGPENEVTSSIENRYGFPALMFRETSSSDDTVGGRVLKNVKVENVGDVPIEFSSLSLKSESHHRLNSRGRSIGQNGRRKDCVGQSANEAFRHCFVGPFSLVGWNCPCDDPCESVPISLRIKRAIVRSLAHLYRRMANKAPILTPNNNETVGHFSGFSLKPNESRVLKIAYSPDCSLRRSFASLHLEYITHSTAMDDVAIEKSRSGKKRRGRGSARSSTGEFIMLVGYENTSLNDMAYCRSHARSFSTAIDALCKNLSQGLRSLSLRSRSKGDETGENSIPYAFRIILCVWSVAFFAAVLPFFLDLIVRAHHRFRSVSVARAAVTSSHTSTTTPGSQSVEAETRNLTTNGWESLHWDLAQSDPTAGDLIHIRKEQTRHLLLAKYKQLGAPSLQCLRPSGAFRREGLHSPPTSLTHRGKGNDTFQASRISFEGDIGTPSLSDEAMVQGLPTPVRTREQSAGGPALPAGLSWRDAAARKVISRSSRAKSTVGNRVSLLLHERAEMRKQNRFANAVVVDAVAMFDDEPGDTEERRGDVARHPSTAKRREQGVLDATPRSRQASGVILGTSSTDLSTEYGDNGLKDEDEREDDDIASLVPRASKADESLPSQHTRKAENAPLDGGVKFLPQRSGAGAGTGDWWQGEKRRHVTASDEIVSVDTGSASKKKQRENLTRNVGGTPAPGSVGLPQKAAVAGVVPSHKKKEKKIHGPIKLATTAMGGGNLQKQRARERAWKHLQEEEPSPSRGNGGGGRRTASAKAREANADRSASQVIPKTSPLTFRGSHGNASQIRPSSPPDTPGKGAHLPANDEREVTQGPSKLVHPPGLAPPPGFSSVRVESDPSNQLAGQDGATQLPSAGPHLDVDNANAELQSADVSWQQRTLATPKDEAVPVDLLLSSTRAVASDRGLDTDYGAVREPVGAHSGSELAGPSSSVEGRPLLGLGGGFNVMDFLDNILDDSAMVEDQHENRVSHDAGDDMSVQSAASGGDARGSEVSGGRDALNNDSNVGAGDIFASIGVSSDPWAASATSLGTHSFRNLAGAGEEGEGKDDSAGKNKDDYFERESFFENLIAGSLKDKGDAS